MNVHVLEITDSFTLASGDVWASRVAVSVHPCACVLLLTLLCVLPLCVCVCVCVFIAGLLLWCCTLRVCVLLTCCCGVISVFVCFFLHCGVCVPCLSQWFLISVFPSDESLGCVQFACTRVTNTELE